MNRTDVEVGVTDRLSVTRKLLTAAAATCGIQALTHATLFLSFEPQAATRQGRIIARMRADSFDYGMLGQRTYWDFYLGYGLIAVVLALLITAVIAIAVATPDRNTQVRLSACAMTTVLAHGAIIARYFFVLPLAFDLVVAVLLAAALVTLRAGSISGMKR
jgi:hypothetical protein